ncbi:putative calcineurin-like phosphoesterase domain, ApaH type, metallo-dependent phosphatase [Plasmopara halstedii]
MQKDDIPKCSDHRAENSFRDCRETFDQLRIYLSDLAAYNDKAFYNSRPTCRGIFILNIINVNVSTSEVMVVERAHPDVALPTVVHRVADDVAASTRLLIVGDVHGCFDELKLLLHACRYSPQTDRLVFVGDLVNKGPKSLEVVRFVRDSGSLCVRGNHDDAALIAYYQYVKGGRVPGSAWYSYVEQFTLEDVEFLEQLPYSISLPNHGNIIVVHAGLVPGVDLEEQKLLHLYRMRFVQREKAEDDNSKWVALERKKYKSECGGEPKMWAKVWKGPRHVYFGHAASAGLQQEPFATGLDTGCCYGKKLTACIIPTNTLVHVDAKEQYEVPSGDKD